MVRFRDERRTCVIIASGASAGTTDLRLAHAWPCIAVNDAWRLAPFADAIYGCDYAWWSIHHAAVREGFPGEKWTANGQASRDFGLQPIGLESRPGLSQRPGIIYSGGRVGNSGAQAINLAVLWGARRLVLVGFDFHGTHFFGEHPKGIHGTSDFTQMRACMAPMAADLHAARIPVINCSAKSALSFWPKASLADALARDAARVPTDPS